MMTSWNGNIFRVTGPLCGEFTGPDEFPAQRPVTRSFYVFFDLRLNKRLSKQSWGWWSETPSSSLWRHRNDEQIHHMNHQKLALQPRKQSLRKPCIYISNVVYCILCIEWLHRRIQIHTLQFCQVMCMIPLLIRECKHPSFCYYQT